MNILLDTHVFLWLATSPERLGPSLKLLDEPGNEIILSSASSWEIAVKYRIGKLALPEHPATWVVAKMHEMALEGIAVGHEHALAVASLPPLHNDPFDRLLVSQARLLGITLLTADPQVEAYASLEPTRDDFIIRVGLQS